MPARLYFLLGRPVRLDRALCGDRAAADGVYLDIKRAVKEGIAWLLAKREEDPFK